MPHRLLSNCKGTIHLRVRLTGIRTCLRAFQGVGGSGGFAVATAMMSDMVAPDKLAKYAANLSTVYALSLLVGPILGGALSSYSTWRWAFLIKYSNCIPLVMWIADIYSIRIATLALIILLLAVPPHFPHQEQQQLGHRILNSVLTTDTCHRINFVGAALPLLATLSLTVAFEEARSQFKWGYAYVIALLVSGVLWSLLLFWERVITSRNSVTEPVLPWRFWTNRAMISLILWVRALL